MSEVEPDAEALVGDVLATVLYFDVFDHPLLLAEIERFVAPGRSAAVQTACTRLEAEGRLAAQGRHRFVPGKEHTVERRRSMAARAERLWPAARRSARWLATLPFVRGVLITGGLSKGVAKDDEDIDFMLLVEPGSVWTLKSGLQGLRRVLPARGRDLLCTNYLLAIDHLEVPEHDVFIAMELATAVPMAGACAPLLAANGWARTFVPGLTWALERAEHAAPLSHRWPRLERALSHPLLEKGSLRSWDSFWNRKYGFLDREVRAQRFKRQSGVSTNHLHDFRGHVLREVAWRYADAGLDRPVVL